MSGGNYWGGARIALWIGDHVHKSYSVGVKVGAEMRSKIEQNNDRGPLLL